MNDSAHFAEYTVEKKYEGAYGRKRVLAIILYILAPIVLLLLLLSNPYTGAIAILIFIPLAPTFFLFVVRTTYGRYFKIEYEYRVATGEMVIAEVYNKKSRKDIFTVTLANAETIAPYRDEYKEACDKESYDRIVDSVSSMSSPDVYFLTVPDEDDRSKKTLVFFEPTAKMLRLLSLYNRKTVVDKVRY